MALVHKFSWHVEGGCVSEAIVFGCVMCFGVIVVGLLLEGLLPLDCSILGVEGYCN